MRPGSVCVLGCGQVFPCLVGFIFFWFGFFVMDLPYQSTCLKPEVEAVHNRLTK